MSTSSSVVLALEKAQRLSDRCDAFFRRREAEQRRKEAKRAAKRDGDSYRPEERNELRTDTLSKHDSYDALQKLHNIRGQLPKRMSDTHTDRVEFSEAQARYDSAFQELGKYGKGPGFAAAPKENKV
jgi:hypothetical protein